MVQEVYSGKDQPINLSDSTSNNNYSYGQPQPQYYSQYAQPQPQVAVYSTTAQPIVIGSTTVQQGYDDYGYHQQRQSDGSLIPCCSTSQRSFDLERAVFVRNVLLIVVAQLLIVAGMSSLFYFVDSIRIFMIEQAYWTWIIAFVAEISTLIILLVVRKKKAPAAVFLFLFTLASGFFVATAVCYYELQVIIEAVVVTLGVTIVCVGYVVITRADFRWLIIVILAISCTVMFWSLFFMFSFIYPSYYALEWYWNLMTLAIILLFVCYLLFDMSLICNKYPTDEHILAAVNLYLDIITIFMYVLMLFGGKK